MEVYRIVKRIYANDLSGDGSRLFGGRWNVQGVSCIYAATSRSLAILELSVNTSKKNIPNDLVMLTIVIPDVCIQQIKVGNLPKNWQAHPSSIETKNFGTKLLTSGKHLAYLLPSAVVLEENNIIINPLHVDIK
ncbi:MAG: RES family NAD+ phosphorylase, partial [Chitinophagaceae bacterium]|nr:RES family NAD+ phosphorylase [Chitinophagaceae bacterium]